MNDKEEDDGVDLERGAFSPNAKGDVVKDPIVGYPPGHNGIDAKRRGNRGAFKVVTLARCILRKVRSGDVKARKADKAAEHEEGEAKGVKLSAEAKSSSYRGRGNAEGDLQMYMGQHHHSQQRLEANGGRVGGPMAPTRSARESSSWPIMLDFFRHRATRPSMKSKKRPKGRKMRARYIRLGSWASPRQ